VTGAIHTMSSSSSPRRRTDRRASRSERGHPRARGPQDAEEEAPQGFVRKPGWSATVGDSREVDEHGYPVTSGQRVSEGGEGVAVPSYGS
jgi:hypothetical protein